MRSDLNKLLCERERVGSRRKFKDVRRTTQRIKLDADGEANMPRFQGILRTHKEGRGDTKSFNENLRPLYGAIRKAVGRKWDAFYSDLCRVFDMRSVINQHILQHLEQYCERQLEYKNGELWLKERNYRGAGKLADSHYVEFYVDPKDGVIKRNKAHASYKSLQRKRDAEEAKKKPIEYLLIDKDTELLKVKGAWFILTYADVPVGKWVDVPHPTIPRMFSSVYHGEVVRDAFTGNSVYYAPPRFNIYTGRSYGEKNRYCKAKRSASHKTLKRYGIV